MSNTSEIDIDLENLFQPAWAQGKSEAKRFEKFTGNEGVKPERSFSGKSGEHRGPRDGSGGGERRGGPPRGSSKFGGRKGGFRDNDPRDERREPERREPLAPLPEINVTFLPDEKGVEQLARQIKMTGRAYPLFQIAQLVLQKAERYSVQLGIKKKADGTVAQPLFVCGLDDSPWLNENEAVEHVLKNHFGTFYQAERIATEPPKGVYTFVAQCGLSGAILGPPNYHDYQNQLRKLHSERFARMPFDQFKARVKIVKDEAVVKKWIEEQSFKTEYNCLNVAEPLKLASLEEVEKHFRAAHKDLIIRPVESHTIAGVPSRNLRSGGLQRLVRGEWEHQKHFPLVVATRLSQQFAQHGLQFFKVNKTITHVSVARPQFLEVESTPVSENIKRIVDFINATVKCTRKKLVEALAPSPKIAKAPVPEMPVVPVAEGETPAKPAEAKAPEATPDQTAIIVDLHWLIHQGHVLEFADGRMETAKKPAPRPPKPEKKPVVEKAAAEIETAPATEVPEPSVKAAVEPVAEISVSAEPSVAPVQPQTSPLAQEGIV